MPTQTPMAYTPQQIAGLDAASRAAYFRQLPASQQQDSRAAYMAYQNQMNRMYMKNTLVKEAVCPQSSGSALSQSWSAGQQLAYTIPSAQNAFTQGVIVRCALTITLASGSSATYALNAGYPLNLFDNIIIQYNGVQSRFRPYFLKYLQMLSGDMMPQIPLAVVAGEQNTTIQNYLNTAINVSTTGSQQTLTFEFYIPFNPLHPQDSRGLLPTMGGETVPQVLITCAANALGVDPVLNAISNVSGSGAAVTVGGTVACYAVYRDGQSYMSPVLQGLDLTGIGTTQMVLDIPLTNLTAGTVNRQKLSIMDKCYYVISTLIDGNQSTKFATTSNIQVIEADKDSVGANLFWRYGTGTNLSVNEFFTQYRGLIPGLGVMQDLDEGILPWVAAPIYMAATAGDMDGTHYLDTSLAGWTDFHYGVQVGSVGGVNGINPRVETHVVLVNSAGLVSA